MAGDREGWRREACKAKNKGNVGVIGIMGRRQVTPRWEDDAVAAAPFLLPK